MSIWPTALRDFILRRVAPAVEVDREYLAQRHIRGKGVEIGSRGWPLRVRPDVEVTHVDCHDVETLRGQCADADEASRIKVDVVDDAQTLGKFENASQDFIIANHVVEHLQDPLSALRRFFEVLKPGGMLFLALPEKRKTFDAERPTTTLEHLRDDQKDGGKTSFRQHHEEAITLTPGIHPDQIPGKIASSMQEQGAIHFHCWTQWEMIEMLMHLRRSEAAFDLLHFSPHGRECLFVA